VKLVANCLLTYLEAQVRLFKPCLQFNSCCKMVRVY
jgi:hypothetical protein